MLYVRGLGDFALLLDVGKCQCGMLADLTDGI